MTLLPRRIRPGIVLALLAIVLALPVTWTDRAPWTGPTPALSYAGGSPDETLGSSPTNQNGGGTTTTTKRAAAMTIRSTTMERTTYDPMTRVLTKRELTRVNWLLVWKFSLASVFRF